MRESPDLNEQFTGFLILQQGQHEWPNYCSIENIWTVENFFFFLVYFSNCIEVSTFQFLMLCLDLMNWS